MIVTLITDASYEYEIRRGAWAAWIKSERGKFEHAGMISHEMGSSTIAEVCAVANGMHIGLKIGVLQPGDRLVMRIDNAAVIKRIEGTTKKGSIKGNDLVVMNSAVKFIRQLRDEHSLTLDIRHIKAHSGTHTPDRWVHNRVDKLAKAHMRAFRDGG